MSEEIVISAEAPKTHTVNLVGKTYKVKPVKSALGVMMAQKFVKDQEDVGAVASGIGDMIKTMFGKEAPKVMKRLEDPEDLLDYVHIMELVKALTEAQTGNPTM